MIEFEPVGIKETFCDTETPEDRAYILGYVLSKDIFLPRGFLDKATVKGNVLDLGCGRGSLGAALKAVNEKINLLGVDIITGYEGKTFRDVCSEIRRNDAAREVTEIKKIGQKFDFVISCGLPPKAIEDLIDKGELKDIVRPGGIVLLMFDAPVGAPSLRKAEEAGFELHSGTFASDPDILFWRNGS